MQKLGLLQSKVRRQCTVNLWFACVSALEIGPTAQTQNTTRSSAHLDICYSVFIHLYNVKYHVICICLCMYHVICICIGHVICKHHGICMCICYICKYHVITYTCTYTYNVITLYVYVYVYVMYMYTLYVYVYVYVMYMYMYMYMYMLYM